MSRAESFCLLRIELIIFSYENTISKKSQSVFSNQLQNFKIFRWTLHFLAKNIFEFKVISVFNSMENITNKSLGVQWFNFFPCSCPLDS